MQILEFSRERTRPIDLFDALSVANVRVGGGQGETHVYCLRFDAGGRIGEHPAGFGQLFLVVEGEAWAAGADGARVALPPGRGAYFAPGELHSKGSDHGATILMIQADAIAPDPQVLVTPEA